jgi:hypothetical protein
MAARLIVSASAPFVMALAMEWLGISLSLAWFVVLGRFRRNGVPL